MSELYTAPTADRPMLAASEVSELLGIHPDSLPYIQHELPRLALPATSLYPASYVEALEASAYWSNRVELGVAAGAFAQTAAGHHAAEASRTNFEKHIDTAIFALGNAALSRSLAADLLHIAPQSITRWKNQGVFDEAALIKGRRSNIPPHLLFRLYQWEQPRSYAEPSEDRPKLSDKLPPGHLLTRAETYEALEISASGFQKTEQQLHCLRFSTGAKRFPRAYIAALLDSEVLDEVESVTRASEFFATSPAAARSIAEGEATLDGLLASAKTGDEHPHIKATELPFTFRVIQRTVRNWLADGTLTALPKPRHSLHTRVSANELRTMYAWTYPAKYPQNPLA